MTQTGSGYSLSKVADDGQLAPENPPFVDSDPRRAWLFQTGVGAMSAALRRASAGRRVFFVNGERDEWVLWDDEDLTPFARREARDMRWRARREAIEMRWMRWRARRERIGAHKEEDHHD